jgi:hypothetical protein
MSDRWALPKATPALAQRIWARQQRPSARKVARAMQQAGYRVHFVTVNRWRAQGWRATAADHPLEVARAELEAVAPMLTGDPETRLVDVIGVPEGKDLDQSADAELLRKAARELAIASTLIGKAIQNRVNDCDLLELVPAIVALGRTIEVLPGAFDQAITLDAADQRSNGLRSLAAHHVRDVGVAGSNPTTPTNT